MQNKITRRRLTHCLALSLTAGVSAAAAEPAPDTLIVTAAKQSRLAPDAAQEKEKLENVAGGTNLIMVEKDTRLATLHDALDYQPGVLVQNFFGGIDQPG